MRADALVDTPVGRLAVTEEDGRITRLRWGGEVIGEPMAIPGVGEYVVFRDTEGNHNSIIQPDMPDLPDLYLLMDTDLPWVDDGLCRDSPTARQTTDNILRTRLEQAVVTYQTVYGQGGARLQQALRASKR